MDDTTLDDPMLLGGHTIMRDRSMTAGRQKEAGESSGVEHGNLSKQIATVTGCMHGNPVIGGEVIEESVPVDLGAHSAKNLAIIQSVDIEHVGRNNTNIKLKDHVEGESDGDNQGGGPKSLPPAPDNVGLGSSNPQLSLVDLGQINEGPIEDTSIIVFKAGSGSQQVTLAPNKNSWRRRARNMGNKINRAAQTITEVVSKSPTKRGAEELVGTTKKVKQIQENSGSLDDELSVVAGNVVQHRRLP